MTYKARNKKTGQVYILTEDQKKGYEADPFMNEGGKCKYTFEPIPGETPKVATPPEAKAAPAKQA